MKKKLVLTAVCAVLIGAGSIPAASATETEVTFEVGGSPLALAAPTTKDFGSTGSSPTAQWIVGQIENVTVTDSRGNLDSAWTAKVSSSAFTTGTGTAAETISNGNVYYWSGTGSPTGDNSLGIYAPGQAIQAAKEGLSAQRTAYTAQGIIGSASFAWSPTIEVNIPSTALVGTYTGVITHSVA